MSIKPIDLQVSIPRSLEVNKINSHDQEKAALFKNHFKQKLDEDIKEQQEVILDISKTKDLKVNKDGRNKKDNDKEKQNFKEQKKRNEQKNKQVNVSTSMFDASI